MKSKTLETVRQVLEGQPTGWAAVCAEAIGPFAGFARSIERPGTNLEELAGLSRNPRVLELDRKVALMRLTAHYLSESEDWKLSGIDHLWDELARDADRLSYIELRARVRGLFKQIAAVKGRRHSERVGGELAAADYASAQSNPFTSTDANAQPNAERKATMPTYVEYKPETLVDRGDHPATIVTVGKPEISKFDENKQSIRITFEITDGKFKSERLSRYYGLNLSSKAALGQLYRRLVGEPTPGRNDLDLLLEQKVSIFVAHKDGDDGPYAVVQDIFALQAAQAEPERTGQAVPF